MTPTRLFSPISIFSQSTVVLPKALITFAAATLVLLASHLGSAQLRQIDTRVLEKIPLKVEFKNQESRDWVEELEVKVTNLSDKPICYLYINLFLDTKTIEGSQQAFSVSFGDSKRLYSEVPEILLNDPVIQPAKSMTFKIEKSQVDGWNLSKTLETFVEPREVELSLGYVLYTDGSGIFPGGIRFKKKAKGIDFPDVTHDDLDSPQLGAGVFFCLQSRAPATSGRTRRMPPSPNDRVYMLITSYFELKTRVA